MILNIYSDHVEIKNLIKEPTNIEVNLPIIDARLPGWLIGNLPHRNDTTWYDADSRVYQTYFISEYDFNLFARLVGILNTPDFRSAVKFFLEARDTSRKNLNAIYFDAGHNPYGKAEDYCFNNNLWTRRAFYQRDVKTNAFWNKAVFNLIDFMLLNHI